MAAFTTIDDPSAHFKVQLYAGNGAANNAITFDDTDTDMQPDLVWIKNRDAADSHCIFDAPRGATKVWHPDDADTQASTDTDTVDSFASDGFQVDADVKVNTSSEDYVAWCWNTQGGAGSANTAGSINTTSTSVSTTAGLSISTYTGNATTGATIGHGLGKAPEFMFFRILSDTAATRVFHIKNTAAPETDHLSLAGNDATADVADTHNDTLPSSTLVTFGNSNVNNGSNDYVGYVWTGIQGFSKFGGYTGNGNVDGTFVYTGFKPAMIIRKRTDSTGYWAMHDNERGATATNVNNFRLYPNLANAESTSASNQVDLLSNGFKCRASNNDQNASGGSYVYAAWAESPFVNSNGVPTTAR
jgi:hypothetical protein